MRNYRKIAAILLVLVFTIQSTLVFAVEVKPISPTDPETKSDVLQGLNQPYGLDKDYLGNIYIADTYNNMIKVINKNGLELVAGGFDGKNTMGFPRGGLVDGKATEARFNKPRDLAVTKAGVIYVADSGNNVIRKIEKGIVSTICGNGKAGFVNGTPSQAQFNLPSALAVSTDGSLYVADTLNSSIRVIKKDGSVETLSLKPDNKTLTTSKLNEPSDLIFDDKGVLYILDSGNQAVKRVENGIISLVAGDIKDINKDTGYVTTGLVNGDKYIAKFNFPKGFAMDSKGNLFVADSWNHVIRVITKEGNVGTYSGSPFNGNIVGDIKDARYNTPTGIVINKDMLVISDMWNNEIKELKIDYNDVSFGYTTEALKALIDTKKTSEAWTFWENKSKISLDKPIIISEDIKYLPFKAMMMHYGYDITWNAAERKVIYKKADVEGFIDVSKGMKLFDNNSYLSLEDFEKVMEKYYKSLDAYKSVIGIDY